MQHILTVPGNVETISNAHDLQRYRHTVLVEVAIFMIRLYGCRLCEMLRHHYITGQLDGLRVIWRLKRVTMCGAFSVQCCFRTIVELLKDNCDIKPRPKLSISGNLVTVLVSLARTDDDTPLCALACAMMIHHRFPAPSLPCMVTFYNC